MSEDEVVEALCHQEERELLAGTSYPFCAVKRRGLQTLASHLRPGSSRSRQVGQKHAVGVPATKNAPLRKHL